MTLADIRTFVRNKLGDSGFDTDIIDSSANWFVNDLYNNTRTRQMETTDELFLSEGDTQVDMPEDMQTLINLTVTSPAVQNLMPLYVEYGDFIRMYPDFVSQSQNPIFAWTDFGGQMRLGAPANADTTIFIEYVRRPESMVDETDECEVPDAYTELVVLGTLARCMQTNEDYGEAEQELANLEPLRTAFIRNEGRGQMKVGPTVMRTNRRRTSGGWGLRNGW